MRIRINRKALYQYLFIYLSIQFIGGRLSVALGSNLFTGGVLLLALGYFFLVDQSLYKRESSTILFLICTFVLMICTVIITLGGLSLSSSLSVITRFLVVMVAMLIDKDKFLHRFLKMVFVFSVISVILYVFVQLAGESLVLNILFSKLYETQGNWQGNSYGLFLICYNFMDSARNAYMFGEPGEYQMLIMLALYFLTFKDREMNRRKRRMYLIVYLITIFTIQSTTGFFNLAMFCICVLLSNSKTINKNMKSAILLVTVILCIYFLFFAGEDSILYTAVLDKITNVSGEFDLGATTGGDRVSAIRGLARVAASSPSTLIWGSGFQGVVRFFGTFSCSGIVNSIIMFGVFTCILIYGYILRNIIKYSNSVFEIVFCIFMIVNNGLSQPDLLAVTSVMVACYGVFIQRHEEAKENLFWGVDYEK